ncbi:hypothetical protein SUGI_0947600 [Cryptomeria japonica]|nr:hypothetical protein SUGI_0947600 [Cryptomeria japonica]
MGEKFKQYESFPVCKSCPGYGVEGMFGVKEEDEEEHPTSSSEVHYKHFFSRVDRVDFQLLSARVLTLMEHVGALYAFCSDTQLVL